MRYGTLCGLWMAMTIYAPTTAAQDELPPVEAPATQQVAPQQTEEAEEPASDAMNGFGVGLKLGVGVIAGQKIASASTSDGASVERRKQTDAGLAIALPIWIGDGHGFAVNLEIFHWRHKEDLGEFGDLKVNYTGFQAAFGAQFQLIDPLYMFVGIGPRFGAVHGGQGVQAGVHVAARLPISVTYYLIDMLGLVGELGVGYGGTGRAAINSSGSSSSFVSGALIDFTLGVRFP